MLQIALALLLCCGCRTAAQDAPPVSAPDRAAQTEGRSSAESIQNALRAAHQACRDIKRGKNADYIPYLAKVNPDLFGIALATADGRVYTMGDADYAFAIESISKVFTLCHVMQAQGSKVIEEKLGANATGLLFNSIIAIEIEPKRTVNPLVNAGAIATVSLVKGSSREAKWQGIIETMNAFAGRTLAVNQEVYRSESETNMRNQAIARLLASYGRIYSDPAEALDLYTRQCSVAVTARDLAVMGATLAKGGVNPLTGKRVVETEHVPKVLAIMATAGLYENTGDWLYRVGLPGKSGVGGGILAVAPGRFAIAAFSPPLDASGNSVRAQEAVVHIARALGANVFSPGP